MHSSRMRTGRTLTVFPPSPQKKLETPRKFGDHPPPENWRHPPPDQTTHPPWTEFLTHACENITLAKTSFRLVTRMHSSGMHTTRLLTIFQHSLHGGGVCMGGCLPRRGSLRPGGVCLGGVCLWVVSTPGGGLSPPLDRPVKT